MPWENVLKLAGPLLLLGGVLLAYKGWRGRKISDHPFCRKCGYDLWGLPRESRVCPECGADRRQVYRTVRIGMWQRRRGLAAAGALLGAAGLGGCLVGHYAYDPSLYKYKPVWLLAWETIDANTARENPALRELSTRLAAGQLTQPQIDHLVDRALAMQGNPSGRWNDRWGEFIEAAHFGHQLSAQRWDRYVRGAMRCTFRAVDGVPILLLKTGFDFQRCGPALQTCEPHYAAAQMSVSGHELDGPERYQVHGIIQPHIDAAPDYLDRTQVNSSTLCQIAPGTEKVKARLDVMLIDSGNGSVLFRGMVDVSADWTPFIAAGL